MKLPNFVPLRVRRFWHWEVEQRWIMSRFNPKAIRPGDFYEDCSYHPVVCTQNDRGDLYGISLIDGTGPRGCSAFHCGPIKMTVSQVLYVKKNWKPDGDPIDWREA